MLVGLGLAAMAAMLVLGMAQQQQQQQLAQQVKQVYVVTASRDIPENTIISPEMLAVKAFPADFAPAGAVATIEEAAGKYAATRVFRDSVLLRAQLSGTKKARDVASNLPPGKVGFWFPMPSLISATGGLKPGDRVDVLLTIKWALSEDESGKRSEGNLYTTQTTLQNVEIFAVGTVEQFVNDSSATPLGSSAGAAARDSAQSAARASRAGDQGALVVLVDHQDAVILKFVKDIDGIVDVVLRSADDAQVVKTDSISNDALIDRFKFRIPLRTYIPNAQQQPSR
jgi:pilus assembly protein CpaB